MFESISFGRDSLVDITSLGDLAECLLYYKQVHAIVDHASFTRLARICGPDTLIGLVEDGHLAITYLENRPVIIAPPGGDHQQYVCALSKFNGKESQNLVPELFHELIGRKGKGRRSAQRILNRISTRTYNDNDLHQSLGSITDSAYTDRIVPRILASYGLTNLPAATRFRVHKENSAFVIDTNLDFVKLNAEYRRNKPNDSLSPALVLDVLYEGYAEVGFAASLASEMAPTPTESVIAEERIASVLETSGRSLNRLSTFKHYAVPHSGSVRDLINDGTRTFEDLRKLIGEAERFKEWVHGQQPEGDLVKSYIDEVSKLTWRTGSLLKNLRFILFNGAQIAAGMALAGPVAGGVAGLVLAATDSYLLDRLLTGWRPHQFVNGPLKKFLDSSPQ